MLRTGTLALYNICGITRKKFEKAIDQEILFPFTGVFISRDSIGMLQLDQVAYPKEHHILPEDFYLSAFASMSMKLMWLPHTLLDCIFEISQMMQIT